MMAEPVKIRPGTIYFFLWILMKIESIFSGAGRRRLSSTLWPELQNFVQKLWSIFPFWMSKHLIHINKIFKQINTSFYRFQLKIDFDWRIDQVYVIFLESYLIQKKKGLIVLWLKFRISATVRLVVRQSVFNAMHNKNLSHFHFLAPLSDLTHSSL